MQRKLLLVDDDNDCRRIARLLLTRAGYEVIEAVDGLTGYERVLAETPQIIVTDWDMPRLNGLDMIRRVRQAQLPWYPYILLVTASEDAELGLDTGADDFVSKPIRANQFLPRVRAGERIVTLQQRLNEQNQQLNRVNQQLNQLATIDPLSGLLNRRAFFTAAESEWRRAQRHGLPLSCLLLDIDHFKRVNDTHGHPAGDAVIARLASVLQSRLRKSDLICRYGGEEFCIWLPNTEPDQAAEVAEAVRQAVREMVVPELGDGPQITVSLGVAARAADLPSERTLIDHADQALLQAKSLGRDRIVRYERGRDLFAGEATLDFSGAAPANPVAVQDAIPIAVVRSFHTVIGWRYPELAQQIDRRLELCRELGPRAGLALQQQRQLEWSAQLADIGWLGVAASRPADSALEAIGARNHCQRALDATLDTLRSCAQDDDLLDCIRYRDAWFDGSRGEPSGQNIPLCARLLAVICAFVELCEATDDPASGPLAATSAALDSMQLRAGRQFDPRLVQQLVELFVVGSHAFGTAHEQSLS